ncbi:hypothetical protein TPE_1517 [Treponema pedis str. T A4]|uniref:Uncharacterized protein n=1 Tax=Treponema pedis str. T A4 TaxID=1291379 RepID=S5ZN41_9SPIR|nr:hypothetical protein TPE_1517 [Treponema pedis str. T A4]
MISERQAVQMAVNPILAVILNKYIAILKNEIVIYTIFT